MIERRLAYAALALLAPLAGVACDGDPASPEPEVGPDQALVTAAMHDSASVLPAGRTEPAPADSVDYDGTLSGSALVEIRSEAGDWISLGEPTVLSFEIFCQETAVIRSDVIVDAGTYTAVRITLDDFVADVAPGGILQGVTHATGLTVTLGPAGGAVVVEKDVAPIELGGGGRATIVFDLNSEVWLDAEAIAGGAAVPEEIAAATLVYVR